MGHPMTDAHTQTEHLTLAYAFPDHAPRTSDPHYHLFHETQRRLKKLGSWKCWIGNADCSAGPLEMHHSLIEFSLANIVDSAHFAALYPEMHIMSDEDLLNFVESEGNMTILCPMHHRGILGIHTIHYPAWIVQRFMKAGAVAPERKV
jgi:hypothetical protein